MGKVEQDGKGERKDDGKPRVDLLPADALMYLGLVYGAGAKKYADRNWERGMANKKMLGPLMRHLFKWMLGETHDPETKLLHLGHVAWNALGLLSYELRRIGTDDRNKLDMRKVSPELRGIVGEVRE